MPRKTFGAVILAIVVNSLLAIAPSAKSSALLVTPSMSTEEINASFAQAAERPGTRIDFVAGTYRLTKTTLGCKGQPAALLLVGSTDVTIDFHGSTLLMSGTDLSSYAQALCLDKNTRLTVRNGALDYRYLPWAQATLVSSTKTTATFRPDPAYLPRFRTVQRIEQFDPNRARYGLYMGTVIELRGESGGTATLNRPIINNGDGTFTVIGAATQGDNFEGLTTEGSYLLESQVYGADGIGLFQNQGVTFDNFKVWAAAGIGFRAYDYVAGQPAQKDIRFKNGAGVTIKPGTTRVQSTNADCIHMGEVRGTVMLVNAVAQGCRDDALNVYGFDALVSEVLDLTHFTIATTRPWAIGDILGAIDPNGVRRGQMRVIKSSIFNGNTTLKVSAIPTGFAARWIIEDISNAADLIVINSRIGANRGRGIVDNARSTKIVGTKFHDIPAAEGILAETSYITYNQGIYPERIEIDGNSFENVNVPTEGGGGGLGAAAIRIQIMSSDGKTEAAPAGPLLVMIKNNHFRKTQNSFVYASGIGDLNISGNNFSDWGRGTESPPNERDYRRCAISVGNTTKLGIGPNVYAGTARSMRVCVKKPELVQH